MLTSLEELPLALVDAGIVTAHVGDTNASEAMLAPRVLGPVCVSPKNGAGRYPLISGYERLTRLIAQGANTTIAWIVSPDRAAEGTACGRAACGRQCAVAVDCIQATIRFGSDESVTFCGRVLDLDMVIQRSGEILARAN